MEELFKDFQACPLCKHVLVGEKTKFFICPQCGEALCRVKDLDEYDGNFCTSCGTNVVSAREKARALTRKQD